MPLTIVRGPVAGGKSQYIAAELQPGQLVADVTRIWAGIGGHERGPDGKYPTRRADDPALSVARRVKALAVRIAAEENIGGFVTTSDSSAEAVQRLVDAGATGGVVTVDPGAPGRVGAARPERRRRRRRRRGRAVPRGGRPLVPGVSMDTFISAEIENPRGGRRRAPGGRDRPGGAGRIGKK